MEENNLSKKENLIESAIKYIGKELNPNTSGVSAYNDEREDFFFYCRKTEKVSVYEAFLNCIFGSDSFQILMSENIKKMYESKNKKEKFMYKFLKMPFVDVWKYILVEHEYYDESSSMSKSEMEKMLGLVMDVAKINSMDFILDNCSDIEKQMFCVSLVKSCKDFSKMNEVFKGIRKKKEEDEKESNKEKEE